jgi:hypothetical protein
MLTASLRLTGTLVDGAEVCRSYYLVADFGAHAGGTSAVISMTLGAPIPDEARLTVKSGGEAAALKIAVEAIRALPGNRGLAVRVVFNKPE